MFNKKNISLLLILFFSLANLEVSYHSLIHDHHENNNLFDQDNEINKECYIIFYSKHSQPDLPKLFILNFINNFEYQIIKFRYFISSQFQQLGYFATAPPKNITF